MIFITKICFTISPLLANSQNLFYHSKNQDGLIPEPDEYGLPLPYPAFQSAPFMTYNLRGE
ncbi:MAG TPA: hypothetical protein DDY57_05535 [Franconibacter pulveris]|nr:hypothetical protein [Franconibacter pulveris]